TSTTSEALRQGRAGSSGWPLCESALMRVGLPWPLREASLAGAGRFLRSRFAAISPPSLLGGAVLRPLPLAQRTTHRADLIAPRPGAQQNRSREALRCRPVVQRLGRETQRGGDVPGRDEIVVAPAGGDEVYLRHCRFSLFRAVFSPRLLK